MADPTPPRRRFQFRLRTLMIVVTLLAAACGLLGWQESIIRNRESLAHPPAGIVAGVGWAIKREDVPLVRWWLGDKQYIHVILYDSASEETIEKYRAAFPEAIVIRESETKSVKPKGGGRWPSG